MEKVYIIYEINNEDTAKINDIEKFFISKVFDDRDIAMQYIKSELSFQCDNNENWSAKIELLENNEVKANVYYYEDWQYSLCLKEMEVE